MDNFNGYFYAQNGPVVFNAVYRKMCNISKSARSFPWECNGIELIKRDLCFPVSAEEGQLFFKPSSILSKVRNAYFVHVWNKVTKKTLLLTNSTAGYIDLARKYCPKVLKASSEYF